MIRDEMVITIKQMDDTLHELFGMIGLQVDPSIYEVARDIAACKACGVPYQLPRFDDIDVPHDQVQTPEEDVASSDEKEDNVPSEKEIQEKE